MIIAMLRLDAYMMISLEIMMMPMVMIINFNKDIFSF